MKPNIQARGFILTESIRKYMELRLAYAVSFANDSIQRVTVHLSDINGPRGGDDKRCQLVFTLKGLPSVVIEDTESNLYVAIDRAVDRAGRTLARQLERKHEHREIRTSGILRTEVINYAE